MAISENNTTPSRRRFLSGSLPVVAAAMGLSGISIAIAKSDMSDQEAVDHHFNELSIALRRLHPEIVEIKRFGSESLLKFGLLAFSS